MGIRKSCYTAQGPQGSLFVVQLLKIPCKRVIFYQKRQTLKPGSRLKLRCDSPVRKLFFSCHDDVYLLPRKQEVHSTDRKRTSTGLTTDRGANSRKLTPRYHPQQQVYEHNIS